MSVKPAEFKLEDLPVVHLNPDGTLSCRNCGERITFLPTYFPPAELPDGAQRSVNCSGCPQATAHESPAGPDVDGKHETINRTDQAEIASFYQNGVFTPKVK